MLGDTRPQLAKSLLTVSKLHDVGKLGLEVELVVISPGLCLKLAQLVPLLADGNLLLDNGVGTLGDLSLDSILKLLLFQALFDVSLDAGLDLRDVDLVDDLGG